MIENAPSTPIAAEEQDEVVEVTDTSLVEEELLVENVSIDGMCGVY